MGTPTSFIWSQLLNTSQLQVFGAHQFYVKAQDLVAIFFPHIHLISFSPQLNLLMCDHLSPEQADTVHQRLPPPPWPVLEQAMFVECSEAHPQVSCVGKACTNAWRCFRYGLSLNLPFHTASALLGLLLAAHSRQHPTSRRCTPLSGPAWPVNTLSLRISHTGVC